MLQKQPDAGKILKFERIRFNPKAIKHGNGLDDKGLTSR